MSKKQLEETGALGLEASEWKQYRVDGDDDGHIEHADIFDSAATLAREIWSKGSLEAGVFAHNQADWYVEEVLAEAEEIEGGCKTSYVDWRVAPLAAEATVAGAEAVLQPNGLAAAPAAAPPAVKAAIAAANSIATTPYVWGGGHGSWYSYGYDCSGAVSFALYGAGLLDTPLTSGSLESYGEPGPGKWITIYANATHAYVVIAGLRWDTVGDANGTGPRWHAEPPYPAGLRRPPPGRVLASPLRAVRNPRRPGKWNHGAGGPLGFDGRNHADLPDAHQPDRRGPADPEEQPRPGDRGEQRGRTDGRQGRHPVRDARRVRLRHRDRGARREDDGEDLGRARLARDDDQPHAHRDARRRTVDSG